MTELTKTVPFRQKVLRMVGQAMCAGRTCRPKTSPGCIRQVILQSIAAQAHIGLDSFGSDL